MLHTPSFIVYVFFSDTNYPKFTCCSGICAHTAFLQKHNFFLGIFAYVHLSLITFRLCSLFQEEMSNILQGPDSHLNCTDSNQRVTKFRISFTKNRHGSSLFSSSSTNIWGKQMHTLRKRVSISHTDYPYTPLLKDLPCNTQSILNPKIKRLKHHIPVLRYKDCGKKVYFIFFKSDIFQSDMIDLFFQR